MNGEYQRFDDQGYPNEPYTQIPQYPPPSYPQQNQIPPTYPQQTPQPYNPYQQVSQQSLYVDDSYIPNPYNYQPQTSAYNYDLNHIEYHDMKVEQWATIPNDQTEYSCYWENQQSFEPQHFFENTKKEKKWNDLAFAIIFIINFLATFIIFIYFLTAEPQMSGYTNWSCIPHIFISLGIGIGLNIVHLLYMTFLPHVYIRLGFVLSCIVVTLGFLIIIFASSLFIFLIIPAIFVLIGLIFACVYWKRSEFSIAVLQQCCLILLRNPSLFLLMFVQTLITTVINFIFFMIIYLILYKGGYLLFLYLIFSYYWISYTLAYIVYSTGCGVAGNWYFLTNTEYEPKYSVWESFKRATTTSFGSNACGAFWLAVINVCRAIVHSNSVNGQGGAILQILKLIALCVISIIECCLTWINRYALIYCSLYGVPFKEGCRRFAELSCNKFADVLFDGSIISISTTFHMFTFTLLGLIVGLLVSSFVIIVEIDFGVFVVLFSTLFTFVIFLVIDFPLEGMTDTLFICFAESPEKLKTSASELYERMRNSYTESMNKRLGRN